MKMNLLGRLALLFALFTTLVFAESYKDTYDRFAQYAGIDRQISIMLDEELLLEAFETQLQSYNIDISQDRKKGVVKIIKETLQKAKPDFEEYFFQLHKKHFSQDDLMELISFYQTDIGKKVMEFNISTVKAAAIDGEETAENILGKYYPEMVEKIEELLQSTK